MKTLDGIQIPTERPMFNERKAMEAGVRFIEASGGRQSLVKLMAMLFLADRRLIAQLGAGLTDDEYYAHEGNVAVPIGIFDHAGRLASFSSRWHQHIECHPDWSVKVLAPVEPEALSSVERAAVESVAHDYAKLDDDAFVRALGAEAPEVADLGTSHFSLRDVLVALGDDPREADEVYRDWASLRRVRNGKQSAAT